MTCVQSKAGFKAALIPVIISALLLGVQKLCMGIELFYLQIGVALFLGVCIALAGMLTGIRRLGHGLNLFIIWNLLTIFGREAAAQVQAVFSGQPFHIWRSTFYYDEPMIVLVLWSAVFMVCVFLRLWRIDEKDTAQYRGQCQSFFASATSVFRIYYVFLLIYVFLFFRMGLGASIKPSTLNLIPFHMVASYFQGTRAGSYEILVIFFGNVFLFLPMGFYFCWKHAKWGKWLWLTPVIISCFIEVTQLLTRLGQCDIDDVLLNCLGFYLGMWLKMGMDAFRKNRTNDKETTIFYELK